MELNSIIQEEESIPIQENVSDQPTDVGPTVQSKVQKNNSILPRKNQTVEFRYSDSDWNKVKILGPAGKKGGVHRNWLNVKDENEKQFSMDWESVSEWKLTEPDDIPKDADTNETFVTCVALTVPDEFLEAKKDELSKWREYEAYHEVADIGQPRLSGRWVCTRKTVNGQIIRKARYVIKGFQEDASIPSDSPTGSKESLRIMLSTVASKQWIINSIDIRSAFLQGKPIERDVFIVPPDTANTSNVLWKLEKCIYGLNDAARMWYFAVWQQLKSLGCQRSAIDYGIFYFIDEHDGLTGIIQAHVDDFLWAGTETFEKNVIQKLCGKFTAGRTASRNFKYVGININQSDNKEIHVDQFDYINSIDAIPLNRQRQMEKSSNCTKEETSLYCKLVGKLNWVATQSRPDIAFEVSMMSSAMKSPKVENIIKANKVLQRVRSNPLSIYFPSLQSLEKCSSLCCSDASLGNLPSGQSSGGYILFLSDSKGKICPLAWRSRTLRRVVRSTIAAETSAMVDALDASYCISRIFAQMVSCPSVKIQAITDNESLYRNAHSTTMSDEHRLRVDIAIIKEMISRKELNGIKWVPAKLQLADCLTKLGADPTKLTAVLEAGRCNYSVAM